MFSGWEILPFVLAGLAFTIAGLCGLSLAGIALSWVFAADDPSNSIIFGFAPSAVIVGAISLIVGYLSYSFGRELEKRTHR